MFLEQLNLVNFRNYESINIKLTEKINIFYGKNAQGKTNLLESIYFLGMSKSYRTKTDEELLKYNKKMYKVEGVINKDNLKNKYTIKYNIDGKRYFINNNESKKISEYISNINIVTFTPDDIEILKGLPDVRRKYIDNELSQLYNMYYKVNNEYKKVLKMRNDILKNINVPFDKNYFNVLTKYLIEKAVFIYRARRKFIDKLNEEVEEIYKTIIGLPGFRIIYKNQLELENFSNEELKEKLEKIYRDNFNKEKDSGITLYGPHRDDFEFVLGDNNLKYYGSQGQQKLSVLTMKLAELKLFKKQTGYNPILLLDDVFSEFDNEKINNIMKYVINDIQVIITTTNIKNIKKSILDNSKKFYIDNGIITEK